MTMRMSIQRVGFRKWYERELLQSHAHLVLVVLSLVGLLGGMELYSTGENLASQLTALVCAGASGVICFWALRRYVSQMGHAQQVSEQAVCPACSVYARWDIEDDAQERGHDERLRVRCRGCGNVWHIAL